MNDDPSAPAGRDLVVCCDGTNNTLTGWQHDTNVLLLLRHLQAHPPAAGERERVLYYDPGVGVPDSAPPVGPVDGLRRTWDRVSGLASGGGIYDNIEQAYLFLMRQWRSDADRIFLFGFSRGAFTVRSVAGMVHLFGVLRPEHEALLPTLIRIYFSQPDAGRGVVQRITRRLHAGLVAEGAASRADLGRQVKELFTSAAGAAAWVHWVGVWDTVESVGLPGPLSRSNPSTATLHDKRIRHARHALAFDEHRYAFTPRLYEEPADIATTEHTLKQRWFPGVHSDVGGGYDRAEAGLSNRTLAWMVDELRSQMPALPALPAQPQAAPLRHDPMWSTPWWALAGMQLRNLRPHTAIGQRIAVIPGSGDTAMLPSEWQRRRPWWSLLAALLLAPLLLVLSGQCLLAPDEAALGGADGWALAASAAQAFAAQQLASLWGDGLLAAGQAPWLRPGLQPGWAMAWDLGFIAAWGYLLARIASRGFAALAQAQGHADKPPPWRWLGMAPLAAVGGDIVEDLLTWAALGCHGIGADNAAAATLWLVGCASLAKALGLLGCLPWLVVRYALAFEPGTDAPAPVRQARRLYALASAGLLMTLAWLFARTTVCWGSYGVLGDFFCHSHWAVPLLLAGGFWLMWVVQRDLSQQHRAAFTGKPLRRTRAAWRGYSTLRGAPFWHLSASALLTLALLALAVYLLVWSPFRF